MFCPECGHRQVSNEMRFCARCGLPLGLVTDLLDDSGRQLQREKREITGIGLIMATLLMLINFIIVFGAITLPHLANPVFFWIWASFVIGSLIIGGFGVTNLIRGGFFKRLKEREARLHLTKERTNALGEIATADFEVNAMPPGEPLSVIETTTRELEVVSKFKE